MAPLASIEMTLCMGASIGAGVLVSQTFGAQDEAGVRRTVHNAVALGLMAGVIITVLGVLLASPLLRLLGTPEEVFGSPKREKTRRFIRQLKVLEMDIGSRDFDFPGAVSAIEEWCRKNAISGRVCGRIHLAFEELVEQILLPALAEPLIRFTAEYAEEGDEVDVTVRYNGLNLAPEEMGDGLSWKLLKGAFPELTHEACQPDGEPYANRDRKSTRLNSSH